MLYIHRGKQCNYMKGIEALCLQTGNYLSEMERKQNKMLRSPQNLLSSIRIIKNCDTNVFALNTCICVYIFAYASVKDQTPGRYLE